MEPIVFDFKEGVEKLKQETTWRSYVEGERKNAKIFRFFKDQEGASSALVEFMPGSKAAPHEHLGCEIIFVLSGSFEDEHGKYSAGSLAIFPAGSQHAWSSEEGATLFVVWEKPTKLIK